MGLEIRVDTRDVRRLERRFRRMGARHLPKATAVALTDTAKDAVGHVRGQLGRSFKVRNRGLKNAIAHRAAEKRDARPTALVFTHRWADFLTLHATGGRKRSQSGHRIAIPTKLIKRTATGRIRKTQKPRRLRRRKGFQPGELERRRRIAVRGKKNAGVRVTARGTATGGIFYLVRRSVRIRKVWPFFDMVEASVHRNYGRHFRRRYRKALRLP